MNSRNGNRTEITMRSVVSNAISKGITFEHVARADYTEQIEKSRQEAELEGETKDD